MTKPIELIKDRHSLFIRSLFLTVGLPFFALGLFAAAKVALAVIDITLGRPFEGNLLLGLAIAVMFTGIGGAFVIAFFLPKKVLVFDGETGALTYTRTFPFNIRRVATFALSSLPPPEAVWIEDNDLSDEGYWGVRVTLPNGRSSVFPKHARKPLQGKAKAEALRDEILGLIKAP